MAGARLIGGIAVGALAFAILTPGFGQAEPPAKDVIVVNDTPIPIELVVPDAPVPVSSGDAFQQRISFEGGEQCLDITSPDGRRVHVQTVHFTAQMHEVGDTPDISVRIREDVNGFIQGPEFGVPTLLDQNVGFFRGSLTDVNLFEDPALESNLEVCFRPFNADADVVVSGRVEG